MSRQGLVAILATSQVQLPANNPTLVSCIFRAVPLLVYELIVSEAEQTPVVEHHPHLVNLLACVLGIEFDCLQCHW